LSSAGELRSLTALDDRPGPTLGQDDFRWLLANERARAGRSGRPLQLLLVSLRLDSRPAVHIEPAAAARLLAALRGAARETDVVGWYRQNRIAGVVLTAGAGAQQHDAGATILRRVGSALGRGLPPKVAPQLRLYDLRAGAAPGVDRGRRREPLRVATLRVRDRLKLRDLRKLG
jgi:hypothetical protein